MRLRGPSILAAGVVALVGGSVVAWPLVSGRIARGLETRLQEETGQPWRIRDGVRLGFDPGPHLVLRDLVMGEDRSAPAGYGAAIREAKLSGPISLLFGGSGLAHVTAEGVTLRAPTDPTPRAAVSGRNTTSLAGIAAIRAVVNDPQVALADGDRTLTASAGSVDLDVDLAPGSTKTELRANLMTADFVGTVEVELGSTPSPGTSPIRLALDGRSPKASRFAATAKAAFAPGSLRLDSVSGTIDGAPFTGNLALDHAGKPRLTVDLRLDALNLTDASTPLRPGSDGLTIPVPVDLVPDPKWFALFEAKAVFGVTRLAIGSVRMQKVGVTAIVKDGTLDTVLTSDSAYEGTARARYVLGRAEGSAGRHQVSLSLTRARALPFLSDLAGVRGIDGTASVRIDVQAVGQRLDDLVRSAAGFADLSVADGRIDGLDLAGLVGLLPTSGSDPARRESFLATKLSLLGGSFSVGDGQAATDDLQLKTAFLEAKGVGSIDYIGKTVDVRLTPTVLAPGARRPGKQPGLAVPIRVTGPWSNPSATADISGLAGDPAGTIQTLQGLGTDLLGENGGELGGLLESFFPKRERGAPPRRP